MKLAFLLQCHKSPDQINRLLSQLEHPDVDIFIHVDKKSDIGDAIAQGAHIHLLPDDCRTAVHWGTFSQVQAPLRLLTYAAGHGAYDYYWLISGQDFPIQPIETILAFLQTNKGSNFVHLSPSKNNGQGHTTSLDKRAEIYFPSWMARRSLPVRVLRRLYIQITGGYSHTFRICKRKHIENIHPYFGSNWVCLHADFADYLLRYTEAHPDFVHFFRHVLCPDESFVQTLLMNSPFSGSRKDYLHYVDWSMGTPSPKNLGTADFAAIVHSGKCMARKIDGDCALMDLLEEHINKKK